MNAKNQLPDTPRKAFGPSHAHSYAESVHRQVPGFADLHRMTSMLLAERVPAEGRILVLGAGGGLELKALADEHAGWVFDGIDPSADMLNTAEHIAKDHLSRIRLHQAFIEAAPDGPFDGAVCLLTFHFIPRPSRLYTLRQIHRRLKPDAPFVLAHISFPQSEPERDAWTARHVTFGGTSAANLEAAKQAIASKLTILSPEDEVAMLQEAGFTGVSLFYAGLSFKGWVCTA